ncbi:unnamed protein product [Brassica rapa]|uniref:Uncharacterized protein n=1 Tax=Brassica campestris TaxID=3711 RepID=A0A3P5ZRQ3_BRACM|nr:unnamed protein product [Brassica rapa]VDC78194.1 unnamed protein product [Brassica rapa]
MASCPVLSLTNKTMVNLDDDFRGLKKKKESWMYLEDTFAFYEDYLVIIIFVQSLLIVEHYYFCENGSLS